MSETAPKLAGSIDTPEPLMRLVDRANLIRTIPASVGIGGIVLISWALMLRLGGPHVVAPSWFYLPIVLAAARFGSSGAMVTALVAGVLAGPLAPADVGTGETQSLGESLGRLLSYLVIGGLVGAYLRSQRAAWDVVRGRERATRRPARRLESATTGHPAGADEIREILEGRNVRTLFQPIVELETGNVAGVEALSRFPIEPIQPPDAWLAQAWDVGLGTELDLLLAEMALERAADLPEGMYVSINLSPETLQAGGVARLLSLTHPERIVVEITEHVPVDDYDRLAEMILHLRSAGGRLAIDDVGAGFASLRHVLRLYPDIIKLDVDLVRDIETDPARHALARGIVACARELKATVVAEGVESARSLDELRQLGVLCGQGFHIGHPVPIGELIRPARVVDLTS
ncbi:MAG: EAL domain-containing protein [Actinomycetota bacterium]|nr:EAL domain-containing protein [Actinomycetota bacterium]